MMTEDYVSFETAKLLKDKGFDEFTFSNYNENGIVQFTEVETRVAKGYQRPTLQMTMKWLLKKYNIFICILYIEDLDGFGYTIEDVVNKKCIASSGDSSYKEPEQAYEAAIKYCLENFILNKILNNYDKDMRR